MPSNIEYRALVSPSDYSFSIRPFFVDTIALRRAYSVVRVPRRNKLLKRSITREERQLTFRVTVETDTQVRNQGRNAPGYRNQGRKLELVVFGH